MTPKFTIAELRDSITHYQCGVCGQTRTFYRLDDELSWDGGLVKVKVLVVQLEIFPDDSGCQLARC